MSVINIHPIIAYPCDNEQTRFPFRFKVFSAENLSVYLVEIATGNKIYLLPVTDYTVEPAYNNGYEKGGTVITVKQQPSKYNIVIMRITELEQNIILQYNNPLPPDAVTSELDKAIMILQEQQLVKNNSIHFPLDEKNAITELPPVFVRKNRILSFDNVGNPVTHALRPLRFRGEYKTGAEYHLDDIFRDPHTSSIFIALRSFISSNIDDDLTAGNIDYFLINFSGNAKWIDDYIVKCTGAEVGDVLTFIKLGDELMIVPRKSGGTVKTVLKIPPDAEGDVEFTTHNIPEDGNNLFLNEANLNKSATVINIKDELDEHDKSIILVSSRVTDVETKVENNTTKIEKVESDVDILDKEIILVSSRVTDVETEVENHGHRITQNEKDIKDSAKIKAPSTEGMIPVFAEDNHITAAYKASLKKLAKAIILTNADGMFPPEVIPRFARADTQAFLNDPEWFNHWEGDDGAHVHDVAIVEITGQEVDIHLCIKDYKPPIDVDKISEYWTTYPFSVGIIEVNGHKEYKIHLITDDIPEGVQNQYFTNDRVKNSPAVKLNTSTLSTLSTKVTKLRTDVDQNEKDIVAVRKTANDNKTIVESHEKRLATAEKEIDANTKKVAAHDSDISTLKSSVKTLGDDMAIIKPQVNTNKGDITTLKKQVATKAEQTYVDSTFVKKGETHWVDINEGIPYHPSNYKTIDFNIDAVVMNSDHKMYRGVKKGNKGQPITNKLFWECLISDNYTEAKDHVSFSQKGANALYTFTTASITEVNKKISALDSAKQNKLPFDSDEKHFLNGKGQFTEPAGGGGVPANIIKFETHGNFQYTPSTGTIYIKVYVIGAGGGASTDNNGGYVHTGAGGGGGVTFYLNNPKKTNIIIGKGASHTVGQGESSSFTNIATATGGGEKTDGIYRRMNGGFGTLNKNTVGYCAHGSIGRIMKNDCNNDGIVGNGGSSAFGFGVGAGPNTNAYYGGGGAHLLRSDYKNGADGLVLILEYGSTSSDYKIETITSKPNGKKYANILGSKNIKEYPIGEIINYDPKDWFVDGVFVECPDYVDVGSLYIDSKFTTPAPEHREYYSYDWDNQKWILDDSKKPELIKELSTIIRSNTEKYLKDKQWNLEANPIPPLTFHSIEEALEYITNLKDKTMQALINILEKGEIK